MPHTSLVNPWSKTPRGYHVLCTTPLETRYTISRKMITPLFRISQQRFASSLGIGCVLFHAMCVLWISFRYLSISISYSIYLHPKDGPPLFIFYFFSLHVVDAFMLFSFISIDYHGSGWLMSWLQDDVEDMPCISTNILNLVYIILTSLLNIITCITHTWHVYVLTSTQGEPLLPSFLLARIYCRWKCEGHHTERNRIQEVSVTELKNPNLIFQTCALTFNIITVTCSFRILLWHFVHPPSRMIHFVGI